jgi:hypothetical protein
MVYTHVNQHFDQVHCITLRRYKTGSNGAMMSAQRQEMYTTKYTKQCTNQVAHLEVLTALVQGPLAPSITPLQPLSAKIVACISVVCIATYEKVVVSVQS